MYLVMTYKRPKEADVRAVRLMLGCVESDFIYAGQPTKKIGELMKGERPDSFILTADSRLLQFVPSVVRVEDVYLYREGQPLIKLQEATSRILKPAHNLMKLFDAGEFDKKEGSI